MSAIKAILNVARADGTTGAQIVIREDGSVHAFGDHELSIDGIALALRALADH